MKDFLATWFLRPLTWAAGEAWEKINVAATWRELKELGHKHGKRFFVMAVLWEMVEDLFFPFLAWKFGAPQLIPVFLVLHFEPVVYPVFFWMFRMYDRFMGREPWDPDRLAVSTYWRAATKATTYRILALAIFYFLVSESTLGLWVLMFYTLLMTVFGFVHDRIWHDSNYGIDVPTDTVQTKRVVLKVASYRAVSTLVMGCLFYGLGLDLKAVALYQGIMLLVHVLHEGVWAKSPWGIRPIKA